jgi:hypothetical protein
MGNAAVVYEDSILETDRRSAVIIYDKFRGHFTTGDAVVVGPGMRVRIKPGKRIEILHRDPRASWDDVPRLKPNPFVEGHGGPIGCMASRG